MSEIEKLTELISLLVKKIDEILSQWLLEDSEDQVELP